MHRQARCRERSAHPWHLHVLPEADTSFRSSLPGSDSRRGGCGQGRHSPNSGSYPEPSWCDTRPASAAIQGGRGGPYPLARGVRVTPLPLVPASTNGRSTAFEAVRCAFESRRRIHRSAGSRWAACFGNRTSGGFDSHRSDRRISLRTRAGRAAFSRGDQAGDWRCFTSRCCRVRFPGLVPTARSLVAYDVLLTSDLGSIPSAPTDRDASVSGQA